MTNWTTRILGLLAGVLLLTTAVSAWADDMVIDLGDIECLGSACNYIPEHTDADPNKGTAAVTVKNTGSVAWGDFHFEIYPAGYDITDVSFVDTSPYQPTITGHTLDSWSIDNVTVGATLDLFFYNDPVAVGETVTISVYTDNTVNTAAIFGLLLYPTPVPEPTTLFLLGGGLIGIAYVGRRRGSLR